MIKEAAKVKVLQWDNEEIKQVFVDWAEQDKSEKKVIHYGLDELATCVEDLSK